MHRYRNGKGVYTWSTGHVFEGTWKDDERQEGCLKYANGDVYQGTFVQNQKAGKGAFT